MLTSFSNPPDWNSLELKARPRPESLELCLLHEGRLVGFSHALRHRDRTLRWIDRPVGLPWAVDLLHEATAEWARTKEVPQTLRRAA
jgi:hypothetical protein